MNARRRLGAMSYGLLVVCTIGVAATVGGAQVRAPAAPAPLTLDQLTAPLLVTFAHFVEWPSSSFPSASAPIVVGVVSNETISGALEISSSGKVIGGRSVTVRRLQWNSDLADVHMLFLGEAAKHHALEVLDRVRGRPVLTVSGVAGFGRAGGMITLTVADGRISFAVNSAATSLSGVRLSSFLLSRATKVSDESGRGVP